jgi:hypothetical protein
MFNAAPLEDATAKQINVVNFLQIGAEDNLKF